MPENITFLVTTAKDRSKSKHIPQINSHIAAVKHAKRRNATFGHYLLPEENESPPQLPIGKYRRRTANNFAGAQKPWLVTVRSNEGTWPRDALCTELVPPIRWPVEFTSYEKSLIHFGLHQGRQFSLGEGLTSGYSIVSDWAHRFLESTQMFSICTVVMSEQFMRLLHGRQPTKAFYARQAHAYRLMNDLLYGDNRSATCDEILLAFSQVMVMDLFLGKHEVSRLHAQAVDEYIELCGGLRYILAMPRSSGSPLDPWRFVLYFNNTGMPTPTYARTQALISRFLANLRCIRGWANTMDTKDRSDDVLSPDTRCAINTVHDYVQWSFHDCWKGTENRYFTNIASLYFTYILCLAQAEYSYNAAETLQLFTKLAPRVAQQNYQDSITLLPRPHQVSAISSMAYIREDIIFEQIKEIALCEAIVDVARIASLLPVSTMTKLVETWIDCAFMPLNFQLSQSSTDLESLSEDSLCVVENEIWTAWNLATHAEIA